MKQSFLCLFVLVSTTLIAQEDSLFRSQETGEAAKAPVKIFSTTKAINLNTTEVVGKGKMAFQVSHNFGDIGGSNGGTNSFFGLDNAFDIRIAFEIGLGEKFDLILSRTRGGSVVQQMYEAGFKYQLARQIENDPSHPLSIAFFGNVVAVGSKASPLANQENSFRSFSDRTSYTAQLILARKMGKVSMQLNPTFVSRGYAISYDQKSLFALGGALRFPLAKNLHLVLDYLHTFRNQSSKDSFKVRNNIKFYDPIGVGFEIKVGGHNFHLNFTNAVELLENRLVPRTITTWTNGQFRWGFTISRTFVLWRPKENSN
jgi:hypothetical protein